MRIAEIFMLPSGLGVRDVSRSEKRLKNRNKGEAMIVVLCILAVLMALSLALLLSASVVMGNAQKASIREQCRLTAITFSEALEEKLLEDYVDVTYANENDGIRSYLRSNIGAGWDYYNEAEAGHNSKKKVTRSFTLSGDGVGEDSEFGEITADMYWSWDSSAPVENKELMYDNSMLVVTVTCNYKGQTQKVKSQYSLKCKEENEIDTEEGSKTPVSWTWSRTWRE